MEHVRVYHLTLATRGYSLGENAWSYEAHFTATLPGDMHKVREELRAIAFPYFQRLILKRYGQHIPLEEIRGEFEREELALAPSPDIRVEPLEISYRGKMHHAAKLPTMTLPSDIVAYDPEREFDSSVEEESDESDEGEEWEDDEYEDEDEEYDESTSYEDYDS